VLIFFFFQAEDGIRDLIVTGVQTCALPISAMTTTLVAMVRFALNIPRRARPCAKHTANAASDRAAPKPKAGAWVPATNPWAKPRSEERRVGKEGRTRGALEHYKEKKGKNTK